MNVMRMLDSLERRVARLTKTKTRDEWSPEARLKAAEARRNKSLGSTPGLRAYSRSPEGQLEMKHERAAKRSKTFRRNQGAGPPMPSQDAGTSEGARKAAETRKRGGGSMREKIDAQRKKEGKEPIKTYPVRNANGEIVHVTIPGRDSRRTVDALEKRLTLLTLGRRLKRAEDARDFLHIDGTRK